MLKIKNVTKIYEMGDYTVRALRGVTLAFRESEFVSIIGASGCGKSTLLNIIGGLDRYTTGDLIIGNTSTKSFKAEQWDAYRNATIGFVFQNYNLIPHLTVLENVAMALSLSGVDRAERNKLAAAALERVGMGNELKKKPSQISGGQMQRVAIARALVNNPRIVLADEPTGALDSELSVQVMELLKEVAKDRLVIMVTHNTDLAYEYSTRIVKLHDGLVESDTLPYEWEPDLIEEKAEKASEEAGANGEDTASASRKSKFVAKVAEAQGALNKLGIKMKGQKSPFKATSMKARTAFSLSFKNLITKKRRTFLTSFAGSIGIISLALVLAMSNGFNLFIDNMQMNILATVPIGVYEYSMDYSVMTDMFENYADVVSPDEFPDDGMFHPTTASSSSSGGMSDMISAITKSVGRNDITEEFVEYVKRMDSSWYKALDMYYGVRMNMLAYTRDDDGNYVYSDVTQEPITTNALQIATQVLGDNGLETTNWYQLAGTSDFVGEYYDVIAGSYPKAYNEIVMVVDGNNNIDAEALAQFGVDVYQRDEATGAVLFDGNGDPICKESMSFSEIIGYELKLVPNDTYYTKVSDTRFEKKAASEELYNDPSNVTLKVVGVLRAKPDAMVSLVSTSLCYTSELGEYCLANAGNSEVARAQRALLDADPNTGTYVLGGSLGKDYGISASGDLLGFMTSGLGRTQKLKAIGADTTPVFMNIYPKDFNTKTDITKYIDAWNDQGGNIEYFDVSEMFIHNMRVMLNLMTYVLIAVASISLIVSCVMISIITSNSVVERTREIGILRSLGARKRDISRVFDAETAIIGLFSGVLGIAIAYALVPLANVLIGNASGVYGLLSLNPLHALLLVLLSLGLTVLSGLVPSQAAARKNVVDALRIE